MYRMPSSPATLAISWGSVIRVVTPWRSSSRQYRWGTTMELSTWQWALTKPGLRYFPSKSTVSRPFSYRPTPTTYPPSTATSAGTISPVNTLTTLALRSTRSAWASPRAALMALARSIPVSSFKKAKGCPLHA